MLQIDDSHFYQAFPGDLSQFELLRSLQTMYHSLEPERMHKMWDDEVAEKLPTSIEEIRLTQIVRWNNRLAVLIPKLLEVKGKRLA